MRNGRVLVVGASIAGPTLAHWLARYGFAPTVVERSADLRASGYPIDVRGTAVDVAERMGVLAEIRRLAVHTEALSFVDRTGRRTAGINLRTIRDATDGHDIELLRGDLVRLLFEASRSGVEYRFGVSVRALAPDADGVLVEFDNCATERFDLVIGADGLHSSVRRLAFGPEPDYLRYLGCYAGGAAVDPRFGVADECVLYNVPGRAVAVYRFGDQTAALFLFRRDTLASYDHRDTDAAKRLLANEFADLRWQVPALLSQVLASDEFYFDSVSQIRADSWSRGRVALVGDAAHAPALLSGSGTTLAMVGAYLLAGELAAANGDHRVAFAEYQRRHRELVRRAQRGADQGGGVLVPATRRGIWLRDRLSRLAVLQAVTARLTRPRNRPAAALPTYPTDRQRDQPGVAVIPRLRPDAPASGRSGRNDG